MLLIDPGVIKSLINPEIILIYQTSTRYFWAEIPAFSEFNFNKIIKFYVLKVHNFSDGLIGYEGLRDLDVKSIHPSLSTIIRINYYFSLNSNHILLKLETLNIQFSISNGEIIIVNKLMQNCEIRDCVTTATDSYATAEL